MYEWKSSILSDIWNDSVDNQAEQWPGLIEGNPGYFQTAIGTTRGLLMFRASPFIGNNPQLLHYHSSEIHPMLVPTWQAEQVLAMDILDSGGGYGVLWYGYGHEICSVIWPTWTNDRGLDENSTYMPGSAYVRLPLFESDRPEQRKDWHELRVRSLNVGTTNNDGGIIKVWFRYTE